MYLVEMNRLIHTKRCAVCGVRCVLCIVSTLTFHFMGTRGGGGSKLNRALNSKNGPLNGNGQKYRKICKYRKKSPLHTKCGLRFEESPTSHQKKAHRTRFETYVSIADLHSLYRCDCARFKLRLSLGNLSQSADRSLTACPSFTSDAIRDGSSSHELQSSLRTWGNEPEKEAYHGGCSSSNTSPRRFATLLLLRSIRR